jgi:hypothetical protein
MTRIALAFVLLTGCLMPRQGTSSSSSTGPTSSATESAPTASAPTATPASTAPAGPTTVSVTIRSACSKTAKVFYGDKPGFSSGTSSSISSNSVQSKTFNVGDQMWVTDDSGKGLGSATISANTRNIEINSGCDGLSAR